jgi:hypothetical protein
MSTKTFCDKCGREFKRYESPIAKSAVIYKDEVCIPYMMIGAGPNGATINCNPKISFSIIITEIAPCATDFCDDCVNTAIINSIMDYIQQPKKLQSKDISNVFKS